MSYTKINYLLFTFFIILFTGCGRGGNDTIDNSFSTTTSIFIDTTVKGITYKYDNVINTTNINGEFSHKSGTIVTFNIGNAILGYSSSSILQNYTFPQDLANVDLNE